MHRETVQRRLLQVAHSSVRIRFCQPRAARFPPALYGSGRLWNRSLPGRPNTLELAFDSKRLRTICESESQANVELGGTAAQILRHRLADLRAASSPRDLVAGRPRVLNAADRECMILDLDNGRRLVFTANHPDNPVTDTSHLDWERVTRIKILEIENDHGC
jgi:toxin HigB-1